MAWKLSRERRCRDGDLRARQPRNCRRRACLPADVSAPGELLAIAEARPSTSPSSGPKLPLSLGVVDVFAAAGRAIVGPTRAAAALESSKAFAKDFMARHRVPTARVPRLRVGRRGADGDSTRTNSASRWCSRPMVLRPARGRHRRGSRPRPKRRSATTMVDRRFGDAGERVVLEEFLVGRRRRTSSWPTAPNFVPLAPRRITSASSTMTAARTPEAWVRSRRVR